MTMGTLFFLAFVIGWARFVSWYFAYDTVEKRLTREIYAERAKAKARRHLKLVENAPTEENK